MIDFNKLFTEEDLKRINERKKIEKENEFGSTEISLFKDGELANSKYRINIFKHVYKTKEGYEVDEKLRLGFGEQHYSYFLDKAYINRLRTNYEKGANYFYLNVGSREYVKLEDIINFLDIFKDKIEDILVEDYTPAVTKMLDDINFTGVLNLGESELK